METEQKEQPYGYYAHLDLLEAIQHAQDRHLCTAGEYFILQKFQELSLQAQQVYASLITRASSITLEATLFNHPKISEQCLLELLDSPFLCASEGVSKKVTLELYSLEEINKLCKVLNIKVKGTKQQRIAILLSSSVPIPTSPVYKVMHCDLFERLFRGLYLQHSTEWSQPTIRRLQQYAFYPYLCTPRSLFFSRDDYRLYRLYHHLYKLNQLPHELSPPPSHPQSIYRFSALRYYRKLLFSHANSIEKSNPSYAHHLYQHLQPHHQALVRMLVIYRSHPSPIALFHYVKEQISRVPLSQSLSLYQSLHGLCSFHKLRKGLPPQYREAFHRHFLATPVSKGPLFHYEDQSLSVENYVMTLLRAQDCQVVFSENHLWRYLLSVFFFPVYFQTSNHQFPSPYQYGPLEQHSPIFYRDNKKFMDDILCTIQQGSAHSLYTKHLEEMEHPSFSSLLAQYEPSFIAQLLFTIPPSSFAAILQHLLQHPRESGMPDLCIIAPHQVNLPNFIPNTIPNGLFFVEVKSQGDSMRTHQRAMIDLLLSHNIHVEVWNQRSP